MMDTQATMDNLTLRRNQVARNLPQVMADAEQVPRSAASTGDEKLEQARIRLDYIATGLVTAAGALRGRLLGRR